MDIRHSVADLRIDLCRRVDDVETIVASLQVSNVRIRVSANCPRDESDADGRRGLVRPRILPAFKAVSPLRNRPRSQTINTAAKCQSGSHNSRVTSSCDVIEPPSSIRDVDIECVNTAAVVCTGCRDVQQRPVLLAFCQRGELWSNEQSVQQLAQLMLYHCVMCSAPVHSRSSSRNGVGGVTVIADCRRASSATLHSLLHLLTIVQSSIDIADGRLQSVYALVDEQNRSVLLDATSAASTRRPSPLLPQVVSNAEDLYQYVDRNCLPLNLGGAVDFSQSAWFTYQQTLESFVSECTTAATHLLSATDEVLTVKDLPQTVLESRSLLDRHEQHISSVLQLPSVCQLCTEHHGDKVLHELQQQVQQFGPNATIFREWLERASQLYSQLGEAFERLSLAAEDRAIKLDRCLQLRQFEDRASTVINWLCTEGEDNLKLHTTISNNLRSVEAQLLEFAKFQSVAESYVESSHVMVEEAAMLTQFCVCDETTGLRDVTRELKSRVKSFMERLEKTRMTLDLTRQSYQLLDKMYEWALETMHCVRTVNVDSLRTARDVESALCRLQHFLDMHPSPLTPQVLRDSDDILATIENSRIDELWRTARQRCAETDAEVQRCLAALKQTGVVIPDAQKCCRSTSSDPVSPAAQSTGDESFTRCRSLPPQTTNFNIRDYLIDRCLTDTDTATTTTASDNDNDNDNDIDAADSRATSTDEVDGVCEVPVRPPPLSSHRFSDSELVKRSTLPVMTSPGLLLTPDGTEARLKRHRWKLLRRAFNLFAFDSPNTSDGRGQSVEESPEPCRLDVRSTSVESLPGLRECTQSVDVTEAEAVDTQELMTCRKYGWSAGSTQLFYANKSAVDLQQQQRLDAAPSDDEQLRQNRVLSLIMKELLETEKDYIRALRYVVDNYIPEIMSDAVPQPLRGKKNVVFGNLQNICNFHSASFLQEIESCMHSPYQLGACFLRHESGFYLYALYNKNKPKSDELMTECGSEYFRSKQRQLNDRMDLSSYLLKPVQRMGKYALLLSQISKECPQTHPDYTDLKAALEMVRFQLRHGNDLLAMDCLRSCDVNLHEQGLLLRQAEFIVCHGRKRSLRHVFLFEELVVFSKTQHSPTGHDVYMYKHSIKTTDVGLTESVGDAGDTFELWYRKRTPSTTFVLRATSRLICSDWVRDIASLLWKQTLCNRRRRQAEMACLGVNDRCSFDLTPSRHNIHDRFVDISLSNRPVKLRTSLASRDQLRNGNKRPHSLVSISSSSSSGSSGFTGGLMFHCMHPGAGLGTPVAPLGTLTTMHESPLELTTAAGHTTDHLADENGMIDKPSVNGVEDKLELIEQSSSTAPDDDDDDAAVDANVDVTTEPLMEVNTSQVQRQDAFCQTTLPRRRHSATATEHSVET